MSNTENCSQLFNRLSEISNIVGKGDLNDVDQVVAYVEEAANIHAKLSPKLIQAQKLIAETKARFESSVDN